MDRRLGVRHPKGGLSSKGVSPLSHATVWEESVWEIRRPHRQEGPVRVCRARLVACASGRGTTRRIAGRTVRRSS